MTATDVRRASIRFLDQFIERGACPDVVLVRDRLSNDAEVIARFEALLGGEEVTSREGYDALRGLLAAQREEIQREPRAEDEAPDLSELLSWMDWEFAGGEDDGQTADPAQWHDWVASVVAVGASPDP